MPSLQIAVLSRLDESTISPTSATYHASIDTTWCIGSVPQGGYSLSIILNAVLAFMRTPEVVSTDIKHVSHNDPLLLSATYIQAVSHTPVEVRIRVLKRGKSLSNLQAELWQDGTLRITTQVLLTDFGVQKASAEATRVSDAAEDADDPSKNGYTLTSKSQWAPVFPLSPPDRCPAPRSLGPKGATGQSFSFGDLLTIAEDPHHTHSSHTTNKLSAGAYYSLVPQPAPSLDPDLVATGRLSQGSNVIPFLADMFTSPPMMIPSKHQAHWYPTLHLTIEFKRALPPNLCRSATLSTGTFMINGQHEADSQHWSHPDDKHLFPEPVILAIARQTALVLPYAVNRNKTKTTASKL
ncbi:hypothetical protein EX895_001913 [Sporisorium graminicola]|uniref:Acyl-CoA thioesterase-like N-terminal HotDog domain-containing protein n=1 Tax=Sporisorium graminicola TaxID=280036 RepID=A0A4U7L286_9BASI|nr:hypothetical protein EX895_001913 [Sporisorium graminicola]TKY89382.1 hypothetical protein EX895_001913 [Sporisorium graminicola]